MTERRDGADRRRRERRAVSKNLALRYSYDAHARAWTSDYVTIAVPRWMRPARSAAARQSWRSSVL